MKIRFNYIIPSLALIMGAGLIVLQQVAIKKGIPYDPNITYISILVIVLGVPMYFVPLAKLSDHEFVIYSQIGMVRKRYPISSISDLSVSGNDLYLNKNGNKERISVSKIYRNSSDWKKLLEKIQNK